MCLFLHVCVCVCVCVVDLKSLYAMVLNNRGRILYDVLVYKPDANQTNYLIEVDAKHIDEAMRFFNTYKIKKKVS